MDKQQFRRKVRNYLPHLPSDILKIFIVLCFLFPFYWMLTTSFKTYNESIVTPPTFWPNVFTFSAYKSIFFDYNIEMGSYIRNSVVVTAGVIVLQLIIMVPTAYAFAKYKFYAQEFLFGAVLLAFMIPVQVTFIPIYLMMSKWGMINSLWPQILPFGANAFGIFLLRQGFKQIPDEIIESAKMDAAGEWKIMWRVMVPMAKSSMITIALFSFIATWNSYFWPLVITTSDAFRPLTIAIERIRSNEQGMQWNSIMAGNVLLIIPVIIIYLFASKKIIQAFTYNGVK